MDHTTLVERQFQASVAAKLDCADNAIPALVRAGQLLANCLLTDGKVLIAGEGIAMQDAPWLANSLAQYSERERPGLPAILLPSCPGMQDHADPDHLARSVQALGQPSDVLVLFSHHGTHAALGHAIHAAHERQMNIVILTGHDGGNVPALLDENDVDIHVELTSRFRIHEMFLLLSFALCDLVEWQIFGGD